MRKWLARRRVARLIPLANQWSYDRGYAQGHADMMNAQARCRRPAHLNYNSAPLATVCDGCYTVGVSPVLIPKVDIPLDSFWDAHVSSALETLHLPGCPELIPPFGSPDVCTCPDTDPSEAHRG